MYLLLIIVMRRPHRSRLGVLSLWRAPNLGKTPLRLRYCLLPLLEPDNVLLTPYMISHPLAYVKEIPRHLVPTVGLGAPSSGDLFWTGTLFLPSERSQPGTPDGACPDALQSVDDACAASCLADLLGETRISDEPASDAGTDYPESRLVSLLDQLHVSSEPAAYMESVGSTDPMLVDSDTASLDAFPTNVVIIDDPLP